VEKRLAVALGTNGQVIVDVIPGMELVVGPQPPVSQLGPQESQNRFNLVFRKFIHVFCRQEHPLVIFLDDLQWVDTATLKLIELMITAEETGPLLLVGAYRDNEVGPDHPLAISMSALEQEGAPVTQVNLGPLTQDQVERLIVDSIDSDRESIRNLAEVVVRKTDGNPFFVNQFLTALHQEGLLFLNTDIRKWCIQTERIQDAVVTDNVIDLLLQRLRRLDGLTRNVLQMAACIGNRFDLSILSLIIGREKKDTFGDLLPALQEGLIIPTAPPGVSPEERDDLSETFKFQHDRIQQAAYALIEESDKKEVHLLIGRLMLENTKAEDLKEKIFDILGQLNVAADLIEEPEERIGLARLNLAAGRKAKSATAYEQALSYLQVGLSLLAEDCWERQYELTISLNNEAAESSGLAGLYREQEGLARAVIENARNVLDQVNVYKCLIWGRMNRNQPSLALDVCLEILDKLGVTLTVPEDEEKARRVLLEPLQSLGSQQIESLIDLPALTDPAKEAALRILVETNHAAYIARSELLVPINLNEISIVLNHGNNSIAPFFYTTYAAMLCWLTDDLDAGYRFGLTGMRLLDQLQANEVRSKTLQCFNGHVRHFKEHLKDTLDSLEEGYQSGLEYGDLLRAGFCAQMRCGHAFLLGRNLTWLEKEMSLYHKAIRKTNNLMALGWHEIFYQTVLNLLGKSADPVLLVGDVYNERASLPQNLEARSRSTLGIAYLNKLILCYLFEDYDQGLQNADTGETYLNELAAMVLFPTFHFYDSLVRLAVFRSASENERRRLLEKVEANQKKMALWKHHAPMNYLHKYLLVEGERLRVLGRDMEAIEHYDRAAIEARHQGYLNEEALAYELAAKFWLEKNKDAIASLYLKRARECYDRWGATRKVADLEARYARLLPESLPEAKVRKGNSSSGRAADGADSLDFATMLKASQAISGQIERDSLLTTFMKIVMENVGAQQGFLIIRSRDGLMLEARESVDRGQELIKPSVHLEDARNLAVDIVTYVARTGECVVLDNASEEEHFQADPYIQASRLKSVLAAPIWHQSDLIGVLYLENNLISGAFSPERVEVLELLAAQIAISIENARLYEDLKKSEEKYRGIFENTLEGIYQTTPDGRFISANPALADLFGFDSPQELMAAVTDIEHQLYVSPERRIEFIDLMRQGRTVSGFEVEFYRRDGNRFWALLHAHPTYDENGRLQYFGGIVTDITERKKAMDTLKEREEYLQKENVRLRSNIKDRYRFGNIVGKSAPMKEIYELIIRAAASDVGVIIYGESGTGKELVARAIHEISERKNGALVSVNCGAIPENLLESEFFGYKKGAFTGAHKDKYGFLDVADGGTLFLDELGEIDLNIQAKLLRAIEGGGYTPVGGIEPKNADVRIIAATSRDLSDRVRRGMMRDDFFYRVHIIPIYLPPLRERKEDIPLLVDYFMKTFEYEEKVPPIRGSLLDALMSHDWPGNVRELQNTLHRYVILNRLDFLGDPKKPSIEAEILSAGRNDGVRPGLREAMKQFERDYIIRKLEENDWHQGRVASLLGINRKTLFKKLRTFGVRKPH